MFRLRYILLLPAVIIIFLYGYFKITTNELRIISSVAQVQDKLNTADKNTLIVVDFDDTLGFFSEPYFTSTFRKSSKYQYINKHIANVLASKDNPEEFRSYITSQIHKQGHFIPVETAFIDAINVLLNRGIKVIVLTNQSTGSKYGGAIERMEIWRYENLKKLGLDLSSSFEEQDIVLKKFAQTKSGKPVYYKGILCADRQPKGKVLKAFFKQIRYKPKRVFFFDDKKKNVRSVSNAMKTLNITCEAFVYTASQKMYESLDLDVLRFQINLINQQNEYITVDQAWSLMKNK